MDLNRGLRISFIVHILLILFMIIKVSYFTKPEIDLSQAIRVDMVGLPEKYNSEQANAAMEAEMKKNHELPEKETPPVEEPESVKPEPKAKSEKQIIKNEPKPKVVDSDAVNVNKTKKKQKDALEKLKKLSAIEKIKQAVLQEKLDKQQKSQTSAKPFKGRILTKGTALTGLDKVQSDSYLVQLDGAIKNHWQLPQWLVGKPLKTKILVKFDENGNILSKTVYQTSGNPTYDEYCIRAIEKSSPFPKVPEKFTEVYKEDGVLIGFPE